ncbi:MAG: hypothetical protein ABR515_05730 [Nitrososphaeraceae archaeon]
MNNIDQSSLLHLMETGIISETKIRKTRQAYLTTWVFATANDSERIVEPLISRFVVLRVQNTHLKNLYKSPISKLTKENVDKHMALGISQKVWYELGSTDIRDVVKVARLASNEQELSAVIKMMKRD